MTVTYQSAQAATPPNATQIKTTQSGAAHIQHVILDDSSGNSFSATNPLPTSNVYLEIARGNVTGAGVLNKFGRNPDLDQNTAEDLWDYGGDWTPPTAARVHALVSTSTADDSDGTGARTVNVQGLDANYAVATETVTLDGTTPVNTSGSYVIIYRMIVTSAGSGGYNAGVITATAATDGTVTASIAIGNNQTLMAIWQVAASKTLYMTDYYVSANSITAAAVDVSLWIKPFGETWQLKHFQAVQTAGASYFRHEFVPPLAVSAKSLIKLRGVSSANNTDVSAGFDGVTF